MGKKDCHYNPWHPPEHSSDDFFPHKVPVLLHGNFAIVSSCLHFQDYDNSTAQTSGGFLLFTV